MKDVEIIGMLKAYVQATLVGMGALKGAPCQCVITTNADGTHTVTMKWVDNDGVEHSQDFTVLNGEVGSMSDISDVQLTSLADGQVLAWDSTANKWVNVTNSATVASLENIGDVQFSTLADGQVLIWDDTAGKWKNGTIPVDNALSNSSENPVQNKVIYLALADKANSADLATVATTGDYSDLLNPPTLGTAAAKDATSSVTENSTDVLTSGGAYTALANKADKGTSLSDYGITNAYTKTETDSAISTEIGKLDVSDSATAGSYVTAVSEADGKISVTREAADVTPTANSTKMLTSGGAKTALDAKQDTLTFDNAPTENSDNPVKSGGVYSANQNIYEVMGRNGAKNLIPFDLDAIKAANTEGTWSENVYTRRNVTFTVNSDYSVDVAADGTTNTQASGFFYYSASGAEKFVGKSVTLTGCPISGGSNTYNLQAYRSASVDGSGGTEKDTGSGVTLDWLNDGSGTKAMIAISVGAEVLCNAKFKPMLRYATDTDDTYQPYAKTNRELTSEQGCFTDDQWAAVTALLT